MQDLENQSPSKGLRDRTKLKRTQPKVGTQASSVPTQNNKSDDEEYEESKKPDRLKRSAKKEAASDRPPSKQETDQDPVSDDGIFVPDDAASDDHEEFPLEEDMGEAEEDDAEFVQTTKPRSKSRKKKEGVKTEDGAEESQSDGEGDDNVFIDNLPKDEQSIKILLKEVNRHIRELERQFFEEEDSELENAI